ncbi:hypothetical protein PsorP6_015232 [Peronosclerospora sorghi]|uniref:Uncharacterized protein n=1 Tax=Peronosclerospora sorghi TaxID=230839 RepID=A0ACC0VST0_9STRA|nr:hypothetical protein PsorP6_015232 [Peronosclerospora sorghi]
MELGVFSERQDLIVAVKSYYLAKDVSVVLHKHSNQRRVIFKRYHGGAYRNPLQLTEESRQRNTASRFLGCPFKVVAKSFAQGWKVVSVDGTYNHPLPVNIGEYSNNIVANCKRTAWDSNSFDDFMQQWNQVVHSNDVNDLQANWAAFVQNWTPYNRNALDYIERTWLIHKEKIIRFWMTRIFISELPQLCVEKATILR